MRVKQNRYMFKYIKTIRRRISVGYDEFCESMDMWHSWSGSDYYRDAPDPYFYDGNKIIPAF